MSNYCKTGENGTVTVDILGKEFPVTAVEVVEISMAHRIVEGFFASWYTAYFLRACGLLFLARCILIVILEVFVVHAAMLGHVSISSSLSIPVLKGAL
jgi:hypothetical protein